MIESPIKYVDTTNSPSLREITSLISSSNSPLIGLKIYSAETINTEVSEFNIPCKNQIGFYRDKLGQLMCEELNISTIANRLPNGLSPFYLTSKGQLDYNYDQYSKALQGLDCAFIGYAVKANHNFNILKHLALKGSGAVVVSGNELLMALHAGFDASKIVYNGNGKTMPELIIAINNEVIINIDSEFDLNHIIDAAKMCGKSARTILRINPDIDPKVHEYVSTVLASSKFGIQNNLIPNYLRQIRENQQYIQLIGVHCHIGSTIKNVQIFRDATFLMVGFVKYIREKGFNLEYLDIGGGLGIDYLHDKESNENIPTPMDLINSIRDLVNQMKLKLIIEPGRSLVGNTTIFVNKVIGVKSNGKKNFIVVDGSMSELIRPSLYQTYHHIEIAQPSQEDQQNYLIYDVVGPICESADFLGKDRKLQKPNEGDCLVVYDTGAYCQAISSVYNLRLTCAEYWVENDNIEQIRQPLLLQTYMENFSCIPISISEKEDASQNIINGQNQSIIIIPPLDLQITSNSKSDDPPPSKQDIKPSTINRGKRKLIKMLSMDLEINQIDEEESDDQEITARHINKSNVKNGIENQIKSLSMDQKIKYVDHQSNDESYGFCCSSEDEESQRSNSQMESQDDEKYGQMESSNDEKQESPQKPHQYKTMVKLQQIITKNLEENENQLAESPLKIQSQYIYDSPTKLDNYGNLINDNIDLDDYIQSPSPSDFGSQQLPERNTYQTSKTAVKLSTDVRSPMLNYKQTAEKIPFKIKEMAYQDSQDDESEEQYNLCKNDGAEIDFEQFTSVKKKRSKNLLNIISMQSEQSHKEVISPYIQSENQVKQPSSSVDRMNLLGLRQQSTRIPKLSMRVAGLNGLNLGGMRRLPGGPTSSVVVSERNFKPRNSLPDTKIQINQITDDMQSQSSKKEQFRNRLKISGALSDFKSLNKFKNLKDDENKSSASSRFVFKLDGTNQDIQSQQDQEQLFQNEFEKRYTQLEKLGSGCSSEVFKCMDKLSKSTHAVKIVRSDDDEYIQISKQEFELVRSLFHDSIVKMSRCIHDEHKGSLYLVMEFIEGDTIEDYVKNFKKKNIDISLKRTNSRRQMESQQKVIKKDKFIKEELIHKIIKQLVVTVNYLHKNGVCHRDLKPDNLFFDPETKSIKLMDFNVSKRFIIFKESDTPDTDSVSLNDSPLTPIDPAKKQMDQDKLKEFSGNHPNKVFNMKNQIRQLRTPTGLDQWSAPETRQGGEYSEVIDMWGVGCILYFLITMHPPFIDNNDGQLIKQVQDCQYQELSQSHLDYYSSECTQFLKKLLVADPRSRMTAQQALNSSWIQNEPASEGRAQEMKYQSPRKLKVSTSEIISNALRKVSNPSINVNNNDQVLTPQKKSHFGLMNSSEQKGSSKNLRDRAVARKVFERNEFSPHIGDRINPMMENIKLTIGQRNSHRNLIKKSSFKDILHPSKKKVSRFNPLITMKKEISGYSSDDDEKQEKCIDPPKLAQVTELTLLKDESPEFAKLQLNQSLKSDSGYEDGQDSSGVDYQLVFNELNIDPNFTKKQKSPDIKLRKSNSQILQKINRIRAKGWQNSRIIN